MSATLVFETPGLLDLRALTLMGTSAKPNSSNPLGMFGTGLKYAIASLVRLGTAPVIYVGRTRYDFGTVRDEFRGSEVEVIELRGPVDRRELPYTTGYGSRWEPWMVYRELEANTIDEGGRTYITDDLATGKDTMTRICVPNDALIACHENRDEIFLPHAVRGKPVGSSNVNVNVEVFDTPSRYLYYRGMRVYTLPRSAKRTYNLLCTMDLTEDRTLRYPFMADVYLAEHIVSGDDKRLVLDVLHATKDDYEDSLRYSDSAVPSPAVVEAVIEASATSASMTTSRSPLARHVLRNQPRSDPFARWPLPWRIDQGVVVDANQKPVIGAWVNGPERIDLLDLVVGLANRDAPEHAS